MNNYGFVKPEKDERDYVFGAFNSLPKTVLQPNGNWVSYLPMYENQSTDRFETYGCVIFGTLNALEAIMSKHLSQEFNFAERYNYNLVGVEPPGTDPKLGAESIRKNGVIDQKELPFTDNLSDFRTPRPMSQKYILKGQEWLNKYSFGYEWVYEDKMDKQALKECLKYSPIGISVTAWHQASNGQYESRGLPNNHWCVLYNIGHDGEYYVFDTYDGGYKILTADHDIRFAMRYHLYIKTQEEYLKSTQLNLIQLLQKYVIYLLQKAYRLGNKLLS